MKRHVKRVNVDVPTQRGSFLLKPTAGRLRYLSGEIRSGEQERDSPGVAEYCEMHRPGGDVERRIKIIDDLACLSVRCAVRIVARAVEEMIYLVLYSPKL